MDLPIFKTVITYNFNGKTYYKIITKGEKETMFYATAKEIYEKFLKSHYYVLVIGIIISIYDGIMAATAPTVRDGEGFLAFLLTLVVELFITACVYYFWRMIVAGVCLLISNLEAIKESNQKIVDELKAKNIENNKQEH